MKTVLKILLFLLSAPLMVGLIVWESWHVITTGASYGFWIYGGILLSGAMCLIITITYLITAITARTAKSVSAVRRGTAALVVVGVFFTAGLWSIIDVVFPDLFSTATQGTIKFDDVREDYNHRVDVHMKLMNDFITRNYQNGNLNQKTLNEYLAEGYSNQEVMDLFKTNYKAMNEGGYQTFMHNGPWLNLANSSRLTIPTLVHLIINEREDKVAEFPFLLEAERVTYKKDADGNYIWLNNEGNLITGGYYVLEDRGDAMEKGEGVRWTILDMDGGYTMSIDLGGILGNASGLVSLLVSSLGQAGLEKIENEVAKFIANDAVAGSYIFLDIDLNNMKLNLLSAKEERGVLGYQDMAWLESNHLLLLITSLFPARNIMYVFAGVIVVMGVAIGMIRESQCRKRLGLDKKDPDDDPNVTIAPATQRKSSAPADAGKGRSMSPYMRDYYKAQQEYINRMRR